MNAAAMGLRLARKELNRGDSRETVLATLEETNEACGISIGILNDILSYDKISVGAISLDREHVNAWDFLSDSVKLFKMQVIIFSNVIYQYHIFKIFL